MLAHLRDPILARTLRTASPAGEVRGYRPGPSVRRRFTRQAPAGLIGIGDAVTSVNPVYGQGLSVAIASAQALRAIVLREDGIGDTTVRAARHAIAAATRNPWLMSTSEDARFPSTVGATSGSVTRLQHHYLDRVLERATHDRAVSAAFGEVMSLITNPATLLHPRILGPVLLNATARTR